MQISFLLASAALLLCLSSVVEGESVETLTGVFSSHDLARFRKLLLGSEPYDDLSVPYHVLRSLKVLDITRDANTFKKNACGYSISYFDTSNLDAVFHVSSVAATTDEKCMNEVMKKKSEVESLLTQSLETDVTMDVLYKVTSIRSNLGLEIDSESVLSSILTALDEDESIHNSALAFLTASQLSDIDLSAIFELIEDIVAQADETSTSLYYETLETTSNVISGIFAMATAVGEAPSITIEQATKFGNYLLSNMYTTNITSVGRLLQAAGALNSNKYVVPCALRLVSSGYVSRANPNIQVAISTILGASPVTDVSLTLLTVTDQDGEETSPNKKLTAENEVYTYDMSAVVPTPGIYTVTFSSETVADSPLAQLSEAQVQVTVSYEVIVGSAELALSDREHGTTSKTISLEYPNSSKETLEADQHSKVVMKFTLLNKETKKSVLVHQAFLRLSLGIREIFFVATADKKTRRYTFELDMTSEAEDFASLSGTYSVSLIVGDFALENPFSWDVGSAALTFAGAAVETEEEDYTYKPKPEIQHMFRPDEKRPPKVISSTFTVLVLSPLALLLVLWVAIGVNVSGFGTGGLWAVVFHLGLAGIFVAYYMFWVKFTMFDTLKWLVLLSVPTFLAGNRMLKSIARSRQRE